MKRLLACTLAVAAIVITLAFGGEARPAATLTVSGYLISQSTSSYYWSVSDRHSRRIGYLIMHCGARLQGARECVATLSMPRGKIALNGSVRFLETFSLVVVGGSGIYSSTPGGVFIGTKSGFGFWSFGGLLK